MALSWKNIAVARTNCGADIFGLAGFLRDDDLICHDGPLGRMAGIDSATTPIDNRTYQEHDSAVGSSGWSRAMAEVTYYVALPFVAPMTASPLASL